MNDQYTPEEKETIEALQPIQDVPERAPEQFERGKAAFLTEAKQISNQPVSISPFQRLINRLTQPQPKLRLSTLTIAIIFTAALMVTFSGSVVAARNALPDQPLYSYKLWLEDQRLTLAARNEAQIDLHLDFAEERLHEFQALGLNSSDPLGAQVLADYYVHIAHASQLLADTNNLVEQKTRLQELEALLDKLLTNQRIQDSSESDNNGVLEATQEPPGGDEASPQSTLSPSSTQTPEETEDPETEHGSESQEPEDNENTEEHEDNESPEDTDDPEETNEPGSNTEEPEETDEPDDSEETEEPGSDDSHDSGSSDSEDGSEALPDETPEN